MEIKTRTCIACRKKTNKNNLIRIVSINEEMIVDDSYKINARGTYICKDKKCIAKLLKAKSLSKILKIKMDENKLREALAKMGEF